MSSALRRVEVPAIDYEQDFAAWADEQARLLLGGELGRLDLVNLAEEVGSLGRSHRSEIESRLKVLLLHLLKLVTQPEHRTRSWLGTCVEQRDEIERVIRQSPSLAAVPLEALTAEYGRARRAAATETGLPLAHFPAECPFRIEDVLDPDFLPGATTTSDAPDEAP